MSELLEYFDHLYVINLPSRTDRRLQITNELETHHLPLSSGKITIFPAVRPDQADGWPSVGAKGCFLSHHAVFQDALKRGFEKIVVIEDDLKLVDHFSTSIGQVIGALQAISDWGIVYFGHAKELQNERGVLQRYEQPLQLAHFVGYSAAVLRQLVPFLEEITKRPPGDPAGGPMHVDGAYSWFRRQHPEVHTYLAAPSLGYQRTSLSDITPPSLVQKHPLLRHLVQPLYQLKGFLIGRTKR